MWATTKTYNVSVNLIRVIKHLFDKATTTVLVIGSMEDSFRKTVGVRRESLLLPTRFNILKTIMTDAFEDHKGTVSTGDRPITNLRFVGDIDGEEKELAQLVERLDKASSACGVKISAEKTKLMTNNTSGINTEIKVNGQKFETVTSFKYLGSVLTDDGSKPDSS